MKKWIIIITVIAVGAACAIVHLPARADVSAQEQQTELTLAPTMTPIPTPTKTPEPKIIKLKKLKQNKVKHKVKQSDIYHLAQLMYAENGSAKDDECVLLTGIVVMKRVKAKSYPDTIEGVIAQRGQYATYISGSIKKEPDERCMELAEEILRGRLADKYPDNLLFQAEFPQGRKIYKKFGQEYFCLA